MLQCNVDRKTRKPSWKLNQIVSRKKEREKERESHENWFNDEHFQIDKMIETHEMMMKMCCLVHYISYMSI